jgi:hypothetical protein
LELFSGWKPSEFTAIVFGLVSMVFAWQAHRRASRAEDRAIETDTRARELAFAQRKSEAQALALQGEAALSKAKRMMLGMRDRLLIAGESDLATKILEFSQSYEKRIGIIGILSAELGKGTPPGAPHEQLLAFVDSAITGIRSQADPALIDEEVLTTLAPYETRIRLLELQQAVLKELQRRKQS